MGAERRRRVAEHLEVKRAIAEQQAAAAAAEQAGPRGGPSAAAGCDGGRSGGGGGTSGGGGECGGGAPPRLGRTGPRSRASASAWAVQARWVGVAAFFAALVAHAGTLRNGLILEDDRVVLRNADLRSHYHWTVLFEHDFQGVALSNSASTRTWRPLAVLALRWSYAAHGLWPLGFHLANWLAHAGVAAGVGVLACWLLVGERGGGGGGSAAAAAAALLFATHPVNTEVVTVAAGRAELLAALLFLAALGAYATCCEAVQRNLEAPLWRQGRGAVATVGLLFCAALLLSGAAMLCAEEGAMALGACLAYDLLYAGAPRCYATVSRQVAVAYREPLLQRRWYRRVALLLALGALLWVEAWGRQGLPPSLLHSHHHHQQQQQQQQLPQQMPQQLRRQQGAEHVPWDLNPLPFTRDPWEKGLSLLYVYARVAYLLLNPGALCHNWSVHSRALATVSSITDPRNFASLALLAALAALSRAARFGSSAATTDAMKRRSCSGAATAEVAGGGSADSPAAGTAMERAGPQLRTNSQIAAAAAVAGDKLAQQLTESSLAGSKLGRANDSVLLSSTRSATRVASGGPSARAAREAPCTVLPAPEEVMQQLAEEDISAAKGIVMGLSILLICYAPASHLYSVRLNVIAEKSLYLPSIGWCLLAASLLKRACVRFKMEGCTSQQPAGPKKPGGATRIVYRRSSQLKAAACRGSIFVLVALFGCRSGLRNLDWYTSHQLMLTDALVNTVNSNILHNLGSTYKFRNDTARAELAYQRAIDIRPKYASAMLSLGELFLDQRRNEEAEGIFRKALLAHEELALQNSRVRLRIQLDKAYALNFLGMTLQRKPDNISRLEGEFAFQQATMYAGVQAMYHRATLLEKQNRLEEAYLLYTSVVRQRKDHFMAHTKRALVHQKLVDLREQWLNAHKGWELGEGSCSAQEEDEEFEEFDDGAYDEESESTLAQDDARATPFAPSQRSVRPVPIRGEAPGDDEGGELVQEPALRDPGVLSGGDAPLSSGASPADDAALEDHELSATGVDDLAAGNAGSGSSSGSSSSTDKSATKRRRRKGGG